MFNPCRFLIISVKINLNFILKQTLVQSNVLLFLSRWKHIIPLFFFLQGPSNNLLAANRVSVKGIVHQTWKRCHLLTSMLLQTIMTLFLDPHCVNRERSSEQVLWRSKKEIKTLYKRFVQLHVRIQMWHVPNCQLVMRHLRTNSFQHHCQ